MAKVSQVRQETAVGQGLAIGCLALGVESVPSNKIEFEFAIERAWRSWVPAIQFPQVRVSVERNNMLMIVHNSAGRKGGYAAAWDVSGRELRPFLRQDWSFEELGESAGSEFGIGLTEWCDLAQIFLNELGIDVPDDVTTGA